MKWHKFVTVIVSVTALVVSLLVAWYTSLKPAEVVGDLSYVVVWRLSSNNNGAVTDTVVTPAFWLRNTGALPIIIKDLRLVFLPNNGSSYETYPTSSVPLDAIERSSEFNEYGRLSTGSPFRGFSLTASEQWTSSYKFAVSVEVLQELVGEVKVMVQIYADNGSEWSTVIEDSLNFGRAPYHLQGMVGSAQSIPVYTRRWQQRRQEE